MIRRTISILTGLAAAIAILVAVAVAVAVALPAHAPVASTDGGLFYWNGNAVPGSSVFCAPTSFSVGGTAPCSGSPVPVSTITHGGCTVVRAYVNVHLSDGQEISAPGADVSLRGNGAAAAAC